MDFGAHLPLMDFGGNPYTLDHLVEFASAASSLGFEALSANDHLVFATPWLDGPTALAAVIAASGDMTLATTVALPVVRGPIPLAKALSAIDRLSDGRLVVAVGPGSSEQDYAAVGIDFSERWARLDEAVQTLRSLWQPDERAVRRALVLDGRDRPRTAAGASRAGHPSGSAAGVLRPDCGGWLVSPTAGWPLRTTSLPASSPRRGRASAMSCPARDRDSATFPNALGTMWCYITDDRAEADAIFSERLVPTIHRPEEMLRERLPVGPAEAFAEKLAAFRDAGVQRVFIWPVTDERRQLELFVERVVPLLGD